MKSGKSFLQKEMKKNLMKMSGDSIRLCFQATLRTGISYGEENTREYICLTAERLGDIYDLSQLMGSLAAFLNQYQDFVVKHTEGVLEVLGMTRNRRKKVQERKIYLWVQYSQKSGEVCIASLANSEPFYCSQLDIIDNLEERFGMQLALLVQDDDALKGFYQEYVNWLEPYRAQVEELRTKFMHTLAVSWATLAEALPVKEVKPMPVAVNVPYLIYQMGRILEHYRLSTCRVLPDWHGLGFEMNLNAIQFTCWVDTETFNGVHLYYEDKENTDCFCSRLLDGWQIITLLQELIHLFQPADTPLCRLFAEEMNELIKDKVCL